MATIFLIIDRGIGHLSLLNIGQALGADVFAAFASRTETPLFSTAPTKLFGRVCWCHCCPLVMHHSCHQLEQLDVSSEGVSHNIPQLCWSLRRMGNTKPPHFAFLSGQAISQTNRSKIIIC